MRNQARLDKKAYVFNLKKIACFVCIFIALLIILDTIFLRLVIRSQIVFLRNLGSDSHEFWIIAAILFILVPYTYLFAKWLTIWFMKAEKSKEHRFYLSFLIILVILSLGYWLLPGDVLDNKRIKSIDGYFVGGGYPDEKDLFYLKQQGYSGVISLLDPLLLPQEPLLMYYERYAAKKVGIPLIEIPMLPGELKNSSSIKKIKDLINARVGNEKYYVHAYYGKERVQEFINEANKIGWGNLKTPFCPFYPSYLVNTFKSGKAIQIDDHLIVGPKLTKEEIEQFILKNPNLYIGGTIQNMIYIGQEDQELDLNEPPIEHTQKINFIDIPIRLDPYNPEAVLKIAENIKRLPGMVYMYADEMLPKSIRLSAITLSYLTGLPVIPKVLLGIPMKNGAIERLAPNVLIGPRPVASEFDFLKSLGIKSLVFIGDCAGKEYNEDKTLAKQINFSLICKPPMNQEALITLISTGGPWYLYGPKLSSQFSVLKQLYSYIPYIENEK